MADKEKNNSFSDEEEVRMRARSAERAKQRDEQKKRSDEKKAKRRIVFKKSGAIAKVLLIVTVILSLLFIAAGSLGNVTFSKITDSVRAFFMNMQSGDGYPINAGSGNVDDMFMLGESLVLLEKNEVSVLNKTAKETAIYPHSYSKPMACVGAGRILVCDRVTGRYIINDRSKQLHFAQLHAETFACSLSQKGLYAFSVNASSSSSLVSVYDSEYNKLLDFKCADEYIIALSFSPDSKKLAMIGIGSKNAGLYSKLYVLDIKEKSVITTIDFSGESLSNVFYSSVDNIIVVGENSFSIIQDDKIKETIDFGYNTVSRFDCDPDGNFAIVLSKYGSIDSGAVTLYNSNGEQIYSVDIPGKIECIDYDGKTLCLVDSNNVVYTYNKKGVLIGRSQLAAPAQDVTVRGKYCYVLCFGTISQLPVDTDIS